MNINDFINAIETEWEPDSGFFWKVRQGDFDRQGYTRTLSKLQAMTIDANRDLPRRLVSVLWYIPLFMSWQVERVREAGGDDKDYQIAITAATNEVERLLGTP